MQSQAVCNSLKRFFFSKFLSRIVDSMIGFVGDHCRFVNVRDCMFYDINLLMRHVDPLHIEVFFVHCQGNGIQLQQGCSL